MKVFIDDERSPLKAEEGEWVIVRNPDAAIALIRENAPVITHISFDNDLGFEKEGRDILQAIVGTPAEEGIELPKLEEIRVHSANVVAARAMMDLARSAIKAGCLPSETRVVNRSALHEAYTVNAREMGM